MIGIIHAVSELGKIEKTNSPPLAKREIILAYPSKEQSLSIQVNLIGSVAESLEFKTGLVMAIKNAKVSTFGGLSLNASSLYS